MIFQDIMYSLNPVLSIGTQLTEVIRRHLRYDRTQARRLAEELLRKTGIPQAETVLRKYPHQLSGGQRQRVMTGMAILLITHDIGVVAEMADRVVVMYAGQCVERADTRQLLEAPAHPYTRALLRAVPGIRDDRSRRLMSIPGAVPERYDTMEGCRFAPRCACGDSCSRCARRLTVAEGHEVLCCEAAVRGLESHGA